MKINYRSIPQAELNLTPLIDIVFLLLIFFMVTTQFVNNDSLTLSLPTAQTRSAPAEGRDVIRVYLGKEGFQINQTLFKSLNFSELYAQLSEQSLNEGTTLLLFADNAISYQRVVDVIDIAGQLGISNVQLTTQRDETAATNVGN